MISRNLEKYRRRILKTDSAADVPKIPPPHQTAGGKYIKSTVYGGLDGIITTFAIVSGVAGASLEPSVILILGSANLFADGISMACGDFLSTRAENEYHALERSREEWELENDPEGERQELMEFYLAKGISEENAKIITDILFQHPETVVDIMMIEELGIMESNESPAGNAFATFGSFVVFGSLPLLIYVVEKVIPESNFGPPLPIAMGLTATTLFALGALKTRFTGRSWIWSGVEMLVVGGIAATAAYVIGFLLEGLAP